jgi:hypothetical protein
MLAFHHRQVLSQDLVLEGRLAKDFSDTEVRAQTFKQQRKEMKDSTFYS